MFLFTIALYLFVLLAFPATTSSAHHSHDVAPAAVRVAVRGRSDSLTPDDAAPAPPPVIADHPVRSQRSRSIVEELGDQLFPAPSTAPVGFAEAPSEPPPSPAASCGKHRGQHRRNRAVDLRIFTQTSTSSLPVIVEPVMRDALSASCPPATAHAPATPDLSPLLTTPWSAPASATLKSPSAFLYHGLSASTATSPRGGKASVLARMAAANRQRQRLFVGAALSSPLLPAASS